jgi:ribose transport system ATP-binding protein
MTVLGVDSLWKRYGDREVLRGVSLELQAGEIRALLGANGAGKSTLISCLSGATKPDSGTIFLDGVSFETLTPRTAFDHGLAVIYQHFSLIPQLSVADNIFLGDEKVHGGRVDRRGQRRIAAEILRDLDSPLSPTAITGDLSVGERQLIEIAKVMRRKPRVLILDEPTAALGQHEADLLGERLKSLASNQGIGIIYISHLLGEVFKIADTISILRDGEMVLDGPLIKFSQREVISAIAPTFEGGRRDITSAKGPSEPLLSLRGLRTSFVGPVDVEVPRGHITALFGLLGAGRTEILESIMGMRTRDGGEIHYRGKPIRGGTPRRAIERGIAFVPAERKERGVFADLTAKDNLLLPHFQRLSRWSSRMPRTELRAFKEAADRVRLTPPTPGLMGSSFSGGNQQKLVVGRWLVPGSEVQLLLLDEPTQGIDIGARGDLYQLIRDESRDNNLTTLFASSDPDEVLQLADSVYVLHRGQVVLAAPTRELEVGDLLAAAHGSITTDELERLTS